MIFTSKNENNEIETILINCDCGCGNVLEIKKFDNEIYISYSNGIFYNKQKGFDFEHSKFNYILKNIKKKKIYLNDIIIKNKDLDKFLDAINGLNIENSSLVTNINKARLTLEEIRISEEILPDFSICLISELTNKDFLFNKEYRAYEIILNKNEWDTFVRRCNNYIKKHNIATPKEDNLEIKEEIKES